MEGVAHSQTKVDKRGFVWLQRERWPRCVDVTAGNGGRSAGGHGEGLQGRRGSSLPRSPPLPLAPI